MRDTVQSLKKENDSLKAQLDALTNDFKSLQRNLEQQQSTTGGRNGDVNSRQEHAETMKSLEFLSGEYDDLHHFRNTAKQELSKLSTRLSELADRLDTIGATIDELQRHSYQFNVKILGVPEASPRETALDTSHMCVKLFQSMGAESVTLQDIDIAHRVPPTNPSANPQPIVCRFTRRLARELVTKFRKDASKVDASRIGLPEEASLSGVVILDHLTPRMQQLLSDAKRFKERHQYNYCLTKNSIVFLRKTEDSRPLKITSQSDLARVAEQEGP